MSSGATNRRCAAPSRAWDAHPPTAVDATRGRRITSHTQSGACVGVFGKAGIHSSPAGPVGNESLPLEVRPGSRSIHQPPGSAGLPG